MASDSKPDLDALLTELLNKPEADRPAFLDLLCRDDDKLRAELEGLLEAHAEAGSFLESPAVDVSQTILEKPTEGPGSVIDRYKILQMIGEGGFGVVYMAEQTHPVKRRVALKIIKLGMDTKQVIARFEAERQALAMMDHPHIAKVLDAGATDTGRPYFVMELVKGVPITEYCDTESLETNQRLNLFMDVCHAVQHAHQKGIIHRDLKPNNVMVTLHDGKPVPKVIDFGIAKATNRELTDKTLFTEFKQFIGTPEYMSPEQAEMSGLDIDTRSDIYSLGVLLYELLTGTTPFDGKQLRRAAMGEIQRIIREEEPHKPSTRLSTLGDEVLSIARHRREQPAGLAKALKGDLDWIVMKALEKDRVRHYETANGFAMDIKRYLSDEPVVASPPSAGYKLRKFVRRNRGGVVIGAVIAAVLLLATGISMTFGVLATQARDSMNLARVELSSALDSEREARHLAVENETKALDEASRAERELARANEVKQIINDMLSAVAPSVAQGADITLLKQVLDGTAARLDAGEIEDPLIEAELRIIVGQTYERLAQYDDAFRHLPEALSIRMETLGPEHADTLGVMNRLWVLYCNQDRFDEAEPLVTEALATQRRVLGAENRDTLGTLAFLGWVYFHQGRIDEAEPIFLEAIEKMSRDLGPNNSYTLSTKGKLGWMYYTQRRYADAEPLLEAVMVAKRRHQARGGPIPYKAMRQLGTLRTAQGRLDEAEQLLVPALAEARRIMGPSRKTTQNAMQSLAGVYERQGRIDESEALRVERLEAQRNASGDDDPGTLGYTDSLARFYVRLGRLDEAEQRFEEVLAGLRRTLEPHSEQLQDSIESLALFFMRQDRADEALPLFEEVLASRRTNPDPDHRGVLIASNNLQILYGQLGRDDDAETLAREALEVSERVNSREHESTLTAMNGLAYLLLTRDPADARQPSEALRLATQACALGETLCPDDMWAFLDTLALAQHQLGDHAAAVENQRRAVSLIPDREPASTREELEEPLATYEAALSAQSGKGSTGGDP